MEKMYRKYKDIVDFYIVYISEAHAKERERAGPVIRECANRHLDHLFAGGSSSKESEHARGARTAIRNMDGRRRCEGGHTPSGSSDMAMLYSPVLGRPRALGRMRERRQRALILSIHDFTSQTGGPKQSGMATEDPLITCFRRDTRP